MQCRPRVHFGKSQSHPSVLKEDCTKNYKNGLTHSPGIFTIQCVCSSPKMLGIVVMDASEGLSTAMSAALSRFQHIPKDIYYDNGCNLAKSIVLRCPWVMENTRIVCDRLHYKSHTCATSFDPIATLLLMARILQMRRPLTHNGLTRSLK